MKNIGLLLLLFLSLGCNGQEESQALGEITFHINSNIKNVEDDYFKEITSTWKSYINEREFVREGNEYWNYDGMARPDYSYVSLLLEIYRIVREGKKMQCTFMGLIPVEKDFYLLKTMYSTVDDEITELNHIISVYVKEKEGKYYFYNGTQYCKHVFQNEKVGDVNYIVHPDHEFNAEDAKKMNEFNVRIAKLFEVDPLEFDYVVANNSGDLGEIMGLNFFSYSYQPVQSGGMTDNFNRIVFAGNNSAYYPHEVVHLYTNAKFPRQYHPWVDEGIAAFFGGLACAENENVFGEGSEFSH